MVNGTGFVIHPKKSVLFPTRHLSHVEFLLDLNNMTIRLPLEKAERVQATCGQTTYPGCGPGYWIYSLLLPSCSFGEVALPRPGT